MEPIIEIISKNIVYNSKYDRRIKDEYVSTINRIYTNSITIMQLYRSMDYPLLYNRLNEEIIYLKQQQSYFNKYFDADVKYILNDFFNERIKLYETHMNKL
jgi:hypothetical protein